MTVLTVKKQKLLFNEVARAVSYMYELGRMDNLEEKKLNAEDVQRIIRFTTALANKQCQLLKNNAETLLRLVPALFNAKSSATVHFAIGWSVPMIKSLYEQDPNSAEGERYKAMLEKAGKICFHRRLSPTTTERRAKEFEMFKSIVGETPEYKQAFLKYRAQHRRGLCRGEELMQDAPNAISRNVVHAKMAILDRRGYER